MIFFDVRFQVVFCIVCNIFFMTSAKLIHVPNDYKTIQNALNSAIDTDTVYVSNGIYKENIVMPDHIVLLGEVASKTVIKGKRGKPVIKGSNYSVVKGITVTGGSIGILSENTNMIVQNNIIQGNSQTGIQCLISLPQIQNNVIVDNGWSGIYCELVAYGTRSAIEHNIIAKNGYSGVNLSRRSGVLVQNNIFFQNKQFGLYVSTDSRKSRIIYNNFYENRRSYNPESTIDATNIAIDPELSNINLGEFSFSLEKYTQLSTLGKNGAPIGIVPIGKLDRLYKDADEDGIADGKDACPDIAEDFDGFEDADGCPDKDNDGDGIYDEKDKCPNSAEDFDGFQDFDGCPDKDNDGDGIPDVIDKCPSQPETFNGYKDDDGCPDM